MWQDLKGLERNHFSKQDCIYWAHVVIYLPTFSVVSQSYIQARVKSYGMVYPNADIQTRPDEYTLNVAILIHCL